MAKPKSPKSTGGPSVQKMFNEHGETLLEKVVGAEGPGAAAAQANALRTLIEFTVAKPTQRLDVTGFSGFKIVDVE